MQHLAKTLSDLLLEKGLKLATAESCTGGLLGAAMTENPGASNVFERGFITYSNKAKTGLLGVPADLIEYHGAVSNEVAIAMATGALDNSYADLAISITGIAGPDGGTEDKPVGTVFLGYALKDGLSESIKHQFRGTRADIRTASVTAALKQLISILESEA